MTEICLFRWETTVGEATFLCMQDYILYGVILILIGILMAAFIPFAMPKKVGVMLIILGLALSVGISFFKHLWETNETFKMVVMGSVIFVIMMTIIFAGNETDGKVIKK